MFSVTNLLYSFFNKMSNGIYPEQSIDDYNKENLDIFMEKKTQHYEKWIQFKEHTLCLL